MILPRKLNAERVGGHLSTLWGTMTGMTNTQERFEWLEIAGSDPRPRQRKQKEASAAQIVAGSTRRPQPAVFAAAIATTSTAT
jgi:hypothetical protein